MLQVCCFIGKFYLCLSAVQQVCKPTCDVMDVGAGVDGVRADGVVVTAIDAVAVVGGCACCCSRSCYWYCSCY